MKTEKEVKGFFLTFTDEEISLLREVFEDEKIELTPNGIKQFIFQVIHEGLEEQEERKPGAAERVINGVSRFVKENPDTIRMYAAFAGSILKKIKAGH